MSSLEKIFGGIPGKSFFIGRFADFALIVVLNLQVVIVLEALIPDFSVLFKLIFEIIDLSLDVSFILELLFISRGLFLQKKSQFFSSIYFPRVFLSILIALY
jgi:hypothetical protein